MSLSSADSAPWSFIQWLITGAATLFASALAFMWRLTARVDRIESSLGSQSGLWESKSSASEAAMLRLAERLAQIQDDHFRLREAISGLPTRADLRDIEDRVLEQIGSLIEQPLRAR